LRFFHNIEQPTNAPKTVAITPGLGSGTGGMGVAKAVTAMVEITTARLKVILLMDIIYSP
jgi:hypothetical protein